MGHGSFTLPDPQMHTLVFLKPWVLGALAELLFLLFLSLLLSSMFKALFVLSFLLNFRIPVDMPFPPSSPCQSMDTTDCPSLPHFHLFPLLTGICEATTNPTFPSLCPGYVILWSAL